MSVHVVSRGAYRLLVLDEYGRPLAGAVMTQFGWSVQTGPRQWAPADDRTAAVQALRDVGLALVSARAAARS